MARRGRPRKKMKLVSIDEAIQIVMDFYNTTTPLYSKGTIYNMISQKKINRYGPRHVVLLDEQEVIEKLCG